MMLSGHSYEIVYWRCAETVNRSWYTRPVAFVSRTLTAAERNYSATEMENLPFWGPETFQIIFIEARRGRFYGSRGLVSFVQKEQLISGRLSARPSNIGRAIRTWVRMPYREPLSWAMTNLLLPPGKTLSRAGEQLRERDSPDDCVVTRSRARDDLQEICRNSPNGEIVAPSNTPSILPMPSRPDGGSEEDVEYCADAVEIGKGQRSDPYLIEILKSIESGKLPDEERRARRIALEGPRFDMGDGVLCYCDKAPPYRVRIAVPSRLQPVLLADSHRGRFEGYFSEKHQFALLSQRY